MLAELGLMALVAACIAGISGIDPSGTSTVACELPFKSNRADIDSAAAEVTDPQMSGLAFGLCLSG